MKKIFTCMLILFMMIQLQSLTIVHAATITTPLFSENFVSADWSRRWRVIRNQQWQNTSQPCFFAGAPTAWQIRNHFLGMMIDGPSCVTEIIPLFVDLSQTPSYTFSFDWLFQESTHMDRNVLLKWHDVNNWYGIKILDNILFLQKVVNGVMYWLPNATAKYPFSPNSLYHFRLTQIDQKNISVEINGQKVLEVIDQSPFLTGYQTIGLQASVGTISRSVSYFSNIVVQAIKEISSTPDFVLNVPFLKQTDDQWKELEYDSAHVWAKRVNIADWGCALTSMTMILQFHGIKNFPDGSLITPATLNDWLKSQRDGYIGNGLLNWLAVMRLTRSISEKFNTPKLEYERAPGNEKIAQSEIQASRPVILGIPGHFLVGNGISADNKTLLVLDPFYSYSRFDQYQQTLLSVHTFHPSHTDLSYFLLVHSPELHIAIKDTHGSRIATTENQDFLNDASDISQQTPPLIQTLFPKPNDGRYTIEVSQDSPRPYDFSLYMYDQRGEVTILKFSGAGEAATQTYQFDFQKSRAAETNQTFSFSDFALRLKKEYEEGGIQSTLTYQRLDHITQYALVANESQQKYYAEILHAYIQILAPNITVSARISLLNRLEMLIK